MNLTDPRLSNVIAWIENQNNHGIDWTSLELANKSNKEELEKFLKDKKEEEFWPEELNAKSWRNIVLKMKDISERTIDLEKTRGASKIVGKGQENAAFIPTRKTSSWQQYKNHLKTKGFDQEDIDNIEQSTINTLKQLNIDEENSEPRKGLIVGNVQSGKTANMTGLMSMAADWGFNLFIILSGTIENLRVQTQQRMLEDLNLKGTLSWNELGHLSKVADYKDRLHMLKLDDDSNDRYFTVVLKNATRLRDLQDWLNSDKNQKRKLKILIIDDESDQAGINTMDISQDEKSTIANLIGGIVHNRNSNDQEIESNYFSMNYVGYTATPYANVLNEKGQDTLFPKDFIYVLPTSTQYFGPEQIFGVAEENIQGMNIVRVLEKININEIQDVYSIHEGNISDLPKGLEKAILWFLSASSALRYLGHVEPLSMLVHTSFKIDDHENMDKAIMNWFDQHTNEEIIEKTRQVWSEETRRWTKEDFIEKFIDYKDVININDYPTFENILPELKEILDVGIGRIQSDDSSYEEISFTNGIHISVDNSQSQNLAEDNEIMRIVYPSSQHKIEKAPLFIVIGGNTLARGLTIKGLISTYFLRTTSQADTLMQMGRWFGYRPGYELFPRIFMQHRAFERFEFLSQLDHELRGEIKEMEKIGKNPEEVGLKIKNSPSNAFLRITSDNKMQSAEEYQFDFTGISHQTVVFENDNNILKHNLSLTKQFVDQLGLPSKNEEFWIEDSNVIWENVDYKTVFDGFLNKMIFSDRAKVFNRIENLEEWVAEKTNNGELLGWNVIFASVLSSENGVFKINDHIQVNKVSRTRRLETNFDDNIIDLGVLRAPKDLISDIKHSDIKNAEVTEEGKNEIKSNPSIKGRNKVGLYKKPQLILYCVDKNSKPRTNSERESLNAKHDLIGVSLTIPSIDDEKSHAKALRIRLDKGENGKHEA